MKRETIEKIVLAVFALSALWWPTVSNHMEAEDAYTYAWIAETRDYDELLHPHHRLYHPLSKFVFELSGAERAFPVLIILSGVFSSVALFLFYQSLTVFGVRSFYVRAGYTLCLALSYGFWRYAREVEVYPMAWVAMLFVLLLLGAEKLSIFHWLGLVIGLVVAVNIHVALLVPLGVMAALRVVLFREWLPGIFCGVLTLTLLLGGEFLFKSIAAEPRLAKENPFVAPPSDAPRPKKGLRLSSVPRAAVGLGANVVSGAPLMSFEGVYRFLKDELFPYRNFQDERFLVVGLPRSQKILWLGGLLILGFGVVWLGSDFFKSKGWELLGKYKERRMILGGVGAFTVLILVFEPGNPEMWVIGAPLLGLSIAVLISRPAVMALGMVVLGLGLANWLGGMSLLDEPRRNYSHATGQIIIDSTVSEKDLYFVGAREEVFGGFARYQSQAEVVRAEFTKENRNRLLEKSKEAFDRGGRVFFHISAWNDAVLTIEFLEEARMSREIFKEDGSSELIAKPIL